MIHRGEIYWINLDPTIGAEIKKTRPCLIISNDQANRYSSLLTIIPITSNVEKLYPFEVSLAAGSGGLKKDGTLKINQIKTVDKERVSGKPLGPTLSKSILRQVETAIKIHLDIST